MPACVGQKRHQDENNYDSQLGLKKPNLDIKTWKTGVCECVCVYVWCGSVRFTLLLCQDYSGWNCRTLQILHTERSNALLIFSL